MKKTEMRTEYGADGKPIIPSGYRRLAGGEKSIKGDLSGWHRKDAMGRFTHWIETEVDWGVVHPVDRNADPFSPGIAPAWVMIRKGVA